MIESGYRDSLWLRSVLVDVACRAPISSLGRLRSQFRQSQDVERSAREHEQPVHVGQSPQFHLAHPGDGFQPPEGRFNSRSRVLTLRVAVVSCRAGIDRTTTASRWVLRDVRRDAQVAGEADEIVDVISLVGPDRPTLPLFPRYLRVQPPQASLAFGVSLSLGRTIGRE